MSCPYFRMGVVSGHVAPATAPAHSAEHSPAPLVLARCPAAAFAPPVDYAAELRACRSEVLSLCEDINANPILVRLAWHDSGTYDCRTSSWPACGGANGSIRFATELGHDANAGLVKGITTYLSPIHARHPSVSWADLIQLASATAVAHAGGPVIPMRYGRVDVPSEACCPPSGRLPGAAAPFDDGAADAATHLRNVFFRMGFSDAEIVALSGAHTLGRAFAERSGQSSYGYGNAKATAYTKDSFVARRDGKPGVGMPGGQSWTRHWLSFDNSYFQPSDDPQLLRLQTDSALATDVRFRPHFLRYGQSQAAFFEDYAKAHKKLSELGSAFMPCGGISID